MRELLRCQGRAIIRNVKVVSPYGEIPWGRLSHFDDEEMRTLMKEVVNRIYTVLLRMDDLAFIDGLQRWGRQIARNWDEPEDLEAEARLWTGHP
jgi:hypothetical protein